MAQWPNLEPFPNDSSVGVWHMSDIPLAFGTYAGLNIGNGTITEDEQLLSARLMDVWLTFAEVRCVALLIFCSNTDATPRILKMVFQTVSDGLCTIQMATPWSRSESTIHHHFPSGLQLSMTQPVQSDTCRSRIPPSI